MTINTWKNRFVSLDVETTGLNPDLHEITQIGAVLLQDDFTVDETVEPFTMLVKPVNLGTIETAALTKSHLSLELLLAHGIDHETAVRFWHEWLYKITQIRGGKIIPVGFNIMFDRDFLINFMGRNAYEACFHPHIRDVMQMFIYVHDRLCTAEYKPGFTSFGLKKCCEVLDVINLRPHDALHDCIATAACANRLLRIAFPA